MKKMETKKSFSKIFLFITCSALIPLQSYAQAKQYYTVSEALTYLFPKSEKIDFEKKSLTQKQIQSLKKELKQENIRQNWTLYKATTKGQVDGYAIIDNVKGKELPITYIVSISPKGDIKEVEILVYRESHGGQVKNKVFRDQFVGKTLQDTLQVGQDIQHVSGATISSRSLATGAKKLLKIWNLFYK